MTQRRGIDNGFRRLKKPQTTSLGLGRDISNEPNLQYNLSFVFVQW